jgi:hypothetical protein
MSTPLSAVDASQIRALLLAAPRTWPLVVQKQILALGPAAIEPLLEILEDEEMLAEDGPGDGWVSIHAAALLGELRAEAAIPALIGLLGEDPDAIIPNVAAFALEKIGEPAIEPLLEAAERAEDEFEEGLIAEVLSWSSRKDDRIFALLMRLYRADPEPNMGNLARYGDPRAIPELIQLLESYTPDEELSSMTGQVVIELRYALKELGAELTAAQQALLEQHLAQRIADREEYARLEKLAQESNARLEKLAQESAASATVRGAAKVGRNDPCPCRSGKKYKKCCGR